MKFLTMSNARRKLTNLSAANLRKIDGIGDASGSTLAIRSTGNFSRRRFDIVVEDVRLAGVADAAWLRARAIQFKCPSVEKREWPDSEPCGRFRQQNLWVLAKLDWPDMKTTVVTIHDAKTNLSRLIRKASSGEEVIIARGSKPVARLVPIGETRAQRKPGSLKGSLVVGREFFDALPARELSAWE